MSIKWGEALGRGLRFGIKPKRWLPFFILDGIFMGILLYMVMLNMDTIGAAMTVLSADPLSVISLVNFAVMFVLLSAAWNLLKLWITGATIHHSKKEKEFCKSFRIAANKYPSLLGVAIVGAVLGSLATMVPVAGSIIAILVGLALFFSMQEVMIGKKGFWRAIKGSWDMFQKRPVRIFVMWLLVIIIGGLIVMLFFLPMLITALQIMMPYITQTGEVTAMAAVVAYLMTNVYQLILLGVIGLIGSSISTVFIIKATTEYYMQSKKKFGIF